LKHATATITDRPFGSMATGGRWPDPGLFRQNTRGRPGATLGVPDPARRLPGPGGDPGPPRPPPRPGRRRCRPRVSACSIWAWPPRRCNGGPASARMT